MPHKRAKRSVREKLRSDTGVDTAPEKRSLSKEEVPKSVSRILNAAKIQQEWRAKHKRNSEDAELEAGPARKKQKKASKSADSSNTSDLRIKPGESLAHFNRRVENSMRGDVRTAMQTSSSVARKVKKEEAISKGKQSKSNPIQGKKTRPDSGDDAEEEGKSNQSTQSQHKEFTVLSTSTPRRLNDIVMAPPEIKKLPRGAKLKNQVSSSQSLKDGVLSMAQKAMLEEERERAIRLYREMKQKNLGG